MKNKPKYKTEKRFTRILGVNRAVYLIVKRNCLGIYINTGKSYLEKKIADKICDRLNRQE